MQQMDNFSDGSSLKITIAKWLTPSGLSINETGLEVDMEVEITEDNVINNWDPQLDAALNEVTRQIKEQ